MIDVAFDFIRRNFPELSLGLFVVSIFKVVRRRSSVKKRLVWVTILAWFWLPPAINGFKDRAVRRGMFR